MSDLIILGGNAAIEQAAAKAGFIVEVPFNAGRADATQEMTDPANMVVLEPMADGFRNYMKTEYTLSPEQLLVDKAQLLTLTPPEMTVLVGGMRALNANYDGSQTGILTDTPGELNNNFFRNLLSMEYDWKPKSEKRKIFEGFERGTDNKKWTASRVDLIFGSNSELRALAEVYAADDAKTRFVQDFVAAWAKVMNLDRFDLKYNQ
jgi:catalase-peroxidase